MLVVTWFFVGNVLARTLLSGVPLLAPVVGLVVAAAITLLARRLAMGTVLVVFAGVAAAIPLVASIWGGSQAGDAEAFAFDERTDRPSVLWVVSDELQYPLAFDSDGNVRDELPNLKALQQESTTYTRGYSAANYTDYAVPSMLSGISDVAAQGAERMQDVRAGIGIVPGMSSEYSVVMESPIYSFDCDSADCASVGSGSDVGIVERYVSLREGHRGHRRSHGPGTAVLGTLPLARRQVARLLERRRRVRRRRGGRLRGRRHRRHRRGPGGHPGRAVLRVLAHHPHARPVERRSRRAARSSRRGCRSSRVPTWSAARPTRPTRPTS